MFQEISQNLQENACAGVSFNKVAGLQLETLLKRGCHEYFPANLAEFLRKLFLQTFFYPGRLLLPVIFCLGSGELLRKTVFSAKYNFSEMEK